MGATMTTSNIQIITDEVGRVKTFNDRTPGTQVNMADIWEYTKIRNTQTGKSWDLRLHTAALKGLAGMARLALSEGADVHLKVRQASTALHWAAAKGREEIVKLLVDHGADVNAADELGWTPAFLALKEGFNAIVALLVGKGAKTQAVINGKPMSFSVGADANDQLIEAVEDGNLEATRAAINGGADINCISDDGWTPLLSAVKYDSQITELLLAHGANPNITSDRGYTPLMRAAGLGKLQIVKLLLAAGADKQIRDCDGKTAGQLAMETGQFQCPVMLQ